MKRLPVVSFPGLNADSLGTYLASLGLFSLVTRKWPNVRACWKNERFCLVDGPFTLEEMADQVAGVGANRCWNEYEKLWDADKKADVKKKTSVRTARWRSLRADEELLPLFGAHLALDRRIKMNPLLGTGGNAGKRDFAKGWKEAVKAIENPPRRQSRDTLNEDIQAYLEGRTCHYLGRKFNAGSWFGSDNKIYNHGTKRPFREGEVTPWAMALACEGLVFLAGGTSRQLGSRSQPKGAFPFVTEEMAPKSADEAGGVEAEVWFPIWDRPMTKPELTALFVRGRAELGGKGATTSAAFGAAILGRGVDSGVVEFRRFLLLHTTSSQTFESRLANIVPTPRKAEDSATTRATRIVIALRDSLPRDRKVGQRWRFAGLRGPLEQALVDLAASEPGAGRVERSWALVDEMFGALAKVDRNRTFRSHNVRFQLLPGEWAANLFRDIPPDCEARLALALTSLRRTSECPQFLAYRIGVDKTGRPWEFPESMPTRRVWSDAELATNLCATSERRVMETAQKKADALPPFGATVPVGLDDVRAWLSGDVDEERMRLWLDRLCLFDWSTEAARLLPRKPQQGEQPPIIDSELALYGFFRPLVSNRLFRHVLSASGARSATGTSCTTLGRIMALLRRGDLNAATEAARVAYRSAGVTLADFQISPDTPDQDRLLAALIVPSRAEQVFPVFRRWLTPTQPLNAT